MIFEVLTSGPILFFVLGVLAKAIKSDLDIPHPLPSLFSLYVLVAIGIKGGVELGHTNIEYHYIKILLLAVIGSFGIALIGYYLFKRLTSHTNAIALAATYGSISAVTFITGSALLDRLSIPYGPYMIAAMALMESPAILMALYLHTQKRKVATSSILNTFRHSITNSSIVLLLGSFVIGLILSEDSWKKVSFFYDGIFYGMLTLFLLDLGLVVVKRFEDVKKAPFRLFTAAICLQVAAAFTAFFLAQLLKVGPGDTFLLMLLFGSASYIAAPAAMRTAVPSASPSLYLSFAMGITFPLNILVGIPFYLWVVQQYGG